MSDAPESTEPSEAEPQVPERSKPRKGPYFARNFPKNAELKALVDAFERGNYALVREQAPKLAEATTDPKVAEAARTLRARLEPDPLAVKLLMAAVALLIFLSAWAYHSGH